ncbi:hypothetical protein BC939DRAFT_479645 [Gamsiella multidivaricata]|uniref:uncharacterized protein n=1 Tax=Gamsiella multidivaricata TaxID=101098 RepID=UPI00221FDFDC|nr:uncharacterized protein BC939DRAFT_479645 [Gamsiella multidivaricata]KAG0354215.1 hypothetical protein BGZ54_001746 [Gamsiella multidivaricata]KAI7819279.1 hypothetical protein BC939DRAFT_479645 [Gamsiella multidivaricata]
MSTPKIHRPGTLRLLSLFATLLFNATAIHAQGYIPSPTYQPASVFIEGQAMWVMGGRTISTDSLVPQMFSLDLSASWSTTSPSYKHLPDGYAERGIASTLTKDNQNWFLISNQTMYLYNFAASNWATLENDSHITSSNGIGAATDPETGKIYIPNGYFDSAGVRYELVYDPSYRNSISSTSLPQGLARSFLYSIAWSTSLKGALMFGGFDYATNTTSNDLYLYSPTNGWKLQTATGSIPSPRRAACFVPAYSGSKMILFGGDSNVGSTTDDGPAYGDIYVLDVVTMTWTRGADADLVSARVGHACAVSGDYFIAWGGFNNGNQDGSVPNVITVYNLKSGTWTTDYVYSPPSGSKSNLAVIIGASVSGLVLLILAAVLILRWRRSKEPYVPAPIPLNDPKPITFAAPRAQSTQVQHPYQYISVQSQSQLQSASADTSYYTEPQSHTPQPHTRQFYSPSAN